MQVARHPTSWVARAEHRRLAAADRLPPAGEHAPGITGRRAAAGRAGRR